ncbi:hypothetical protein ES708_03950 [subsurface metagenome]
MRYYFLPDNNGKIIQCGIVDNETALPAEAIETTAETVSNISVSHGLVRWHDKKRQFSFPKNDDRIWKTLMSEGGYTGSSAVTEVKDLQTVKNAFPLDTPASVDLTEGNFFKWSSTFPEYSFPEVAGLIVRSFDLEKDFDNVLQAAIDAGIYTKKEWSLLAERLESPRGMQFLHIWNNIPIQLELYQMNELTANAFRTIHFSKARPYWFWRELMKPVFSWMIERGIEKIISNISTERSDWVEALKRNFNPKVVPVNENTWGAIYPLDLAIFKGWPDRKTLGKNWNIEQDNILVREMSENEIPRVKQFIDLSWKDNPRKALPLEMLEQQYFLDKATILGYFLNGKMTGISTLRYRKDGTVNLTAYAPQPSIPHEVLFKFRDITYEWARLVGYSKLTSFIEKKLLDRNPGIYDHPGYKVVTHTQYRTTMYELEKDLK